MRIRSFFFIFISSSLIFAQDSFTSIAQLSLPLVLTAMIALLAIMYALSQSLHLPQLHSWVKTEIREFIVAAILFVIVLGIINGVAGTLIQVLTGESDYQTAARAYTSDMFTRAYNANHDLIRLYHAVGMRAGFSANLAIPLFYSALTTSGAPYAGYGSFFTFLSQASNDITNMLFVYSALNVLLDFFASPNFTNLIYLAFAFRFIPFTRQLGSTLIALVLGASILFPGVIVLVATLDNPITIPAPLVSPAIFSGTASSPGLEMTLPVGSGVICQSFGVRFLIGNFGELGFALPPCLVVLAISWITGGSVFTACMNLLMGVVYPIVSFGIAVGWGASIVPILFGSAPNLSSIYNLLYPFLLDINHLVVVTYVEIILISILTVIGVKSISAALGGEYMLPGVQKLVG